MGKRTCTVQCTTQTAEIYSIKFHELVKKFEIMNEAVILKNLTQQAMLKLNLHQNMVNQIVDASESMKNQEQQDVKADVSEDEENHQKANQADLGFNRQNLPPQPISRLEYLKTRNEQDKNTPLEVKATQLFSQKQAIPQQQISPNKSTKGQKPITYQNSPTNQQNSVSKVSNYSPSPSRQPKSKFLPQNDKIQQMSKTQDFPQGYKSASNSNDPLIQKIQQTSRAMTQKEQYRGANSRSNTQNFQNQQVQFNTNQRSSFSRRASRKVSLAPQINNNNDMNDQNLDENDLDYYFKNNLFSQVRHPKQRNRVTSNFSSQNKQIPKTAQYTQRKKSIHFQEIVQNQNQLNSNSKTIDIQKNDSFCNNTLNSLGQGSKTTRNSQKRVRAMTANTITFDLDNNNNNNNNNQNNQNTQQNNTIMSSRRASRFGQKNAGIRNESFNETSSPQQNTANNSLGGFKALIESRKNKSRGVVRSAVPPLDSLKEGDREIISIKRQLLDKMMVEGNTGKAQQHSTSIQQQQQQEEEFNNYINMLQLKKPVERQQTDWKKEVHKIFGPKQQQRDLSVPLQRMINHCKYRKKQKTTGRVKTVRNNQYVGFVNLA